MAKTRSRAKQFAEWEEKPAIEHDPEAEVPDESDAGIGSEESANEDEGTEHYEPVGKSKLRRKEQPALGLQYRGSRVSRDALDQSSSDSGSYEDAQEEFDNPDEADLEIDQPDGEDDAEIDSDNAFGESDEEKFKDYTFRGSSLVAPTKGKRVSRSTAADFLYEDDVEEEVEFDDGSENDVEEEDEDELEGNSMLDEEAESTDDDEGEENIDEIQSDVEDMRSGSSEDDEEMLENEGAIHGEFSSGSEDDDEEDKSEDETPAKIGGSGRGDLKAIMGSGHKSVAESMAMALQKDISKGLAVRQQRQAFDGVLNVRIRLQKALVAVNSFNIVDDEGDHSEPYEAAEAAAVKLWNAIDTFRTGMQGKTGEKRKRAIEVSTPNQEIWDNMEATEHQAGARRRAVLDNWSSKVKKMRTINETTAGRLDRKMAKVEKPLTSMLEDQLQDPERLVKRTRTPRSCAPVQATQKIAEDPEIFDDADFYQLLLKELVDQRTTDTSSAAVGGQAATVKYTAVKEAKTKKQVDTKASKGRKMRFNVHEKLQNFMAPEDRRSWEQEAIDRFFGTLFGQKMALEEDEDQGDQEMGGMNGEVVEGLKLF